jgi:prolyl-tRNA editing enzyme YbaK/EbsC (Cys-tRNA(Pro) deacylase)
VFKTGRSHVAVRLERKICIPNGRGLLHAPLYHGSRTALWRPEVTPEISGKSGDQGASRTAEDAARALGCTTAQIVKSLVFRDLDSGAAVMVLASGPNRVDEKVIAAHLGHEVGKADADFVKAVTGYSIGGVPPLGHKNAVTLFVDQDLLGFDEVWAAAGTPHAVFKIPGSSPGCSASTP